MRFVSCVALVISVLATAHADGNQNVAGAIHQNNCKAQLTSHSNHKTSTANVGDPLSPGDSVACTAPGSMGLLVFGRYISISQSGVPYPIPYLRPQHLSADEQMRQAALEQAFRRGGRERSADESEGDSVTEKFVYIILPDGPALVSMLNHADREIWRGQVESHSGILDSTAARNAVSLYEQTGGGTLTVQVSRDGKQQQLRYFVLSRDAEKQLDTSLAAWDNEPSSLMRHIGRATTLTDVMLFEAAAREYEAALADAPESTNLLQAAIEEYERAGDRNRANGLRAKLTPHSH